MRSFKQYFVTEASNSFHEQIFSDKKLGGEWKVVDIEEYASKHGVKKTVPIKELERHLEPTPYEVGDERPDTPEFAERAMRADLNYPIILIDYGPEDGLWVADGVHRIFKAKTIEEEYINAIVITSEELMEIPHEDI